MMMGRFSAFHDLLQDLNAIHSGQTHIQKRQIRNAFLKAGQRHLAVFGFTDGIAASL